MSNNENIEFVEQFGDTTLEDKKLLQESGVYQLLQESVTKSVMLMQGFDVDLKKLLIAASKDKSSLITPENFGSIYGQMLRNYLVNLNSTLISNALLSKVDEPKKALVALHVVDEIRTNCLDALMNDVK